MLKLKLLNGYMVKLLRKLGFFFLFFVSFITDQVSFVSPVYAAPVDWFAKGCAVKETLPSGEVAEIVTLKGLECIFSQILGIVARLAGLAVFVMFILGGWRYLTSGGEKQAAQQARNTLTYAILGLVLLIASWFILRFIKFFTGVDVTKFVITPD